MSNAAQPYLQLPKFTPSNKALSKAIQEDHDLFKKHVMKYLHTLKVYDAVSVLFAAAVLGLSVFVAGRQTKDTYYPLYTPSVQYWLKDNLPNATRDIIDLIQECHDRDFMDDGGPAATWDGKTFLPFYYPHFASNFYPWLLVFIVVGVTLVFVLLRWSLNGRPVPLYQPIGPHFFRWVEYLLTSPLMVVVIAIAAGIRDVHTLIVLGGAQAMLIMLGYLNEHLIADAWDCLLYKLLSQMMMPMECTGAYEVMRKEQRVHRRGTSQPRGGNKAYGPNHNEAGLLHDEKNQSNMENGTDLRCPDMNPNERALAIGNDNLEAAFRLMHVILKAYDEKDGAEKDTQAQDLCNFHYEARLPLIFMRLFVSLFVSWAGFVCMWWVLIGSFQSLADSFDSCAGSAGSGVSVPAGVRAIVWGQFACFALFGLVQTWQAFLTWKEVRRDYEHFDDVSYSHPGGPGEQDFFISSVDKNYRIYYKESTGSFLDATCRYSILNILSKSLLAICLVIISGDMQPSEQ